MENVEDVLAVILAGGKGERLEPLTRDRAKPAVPFGGSYRIIDFTLSNCLNSGIRQMLLLTQYKALSLDRHIKMGWGGFFCRELGEFIDDVPPQQRVAQDWYKGTADAVYQNIYAIEQEHRDYVVILAGDHIYKMNYQSLVQTHLSSKADLTIGAIKVRREDATELGVMQVDGTSRVVNFNEKPTHPAPIPDDPEHALASMGIYVFTTTFLFDQLFKDAARQESKHDFGKNVIPSIIRTHRVFAHEFADENRKQDYWRDVGTLDAYYEANMDLISVDPLLNMYDRNWPIRTYQPNLPPPKFVFAEKGKNGRRGEAVDSIVCPGSIVSGGQVERSIIGFDTRINSYSRVEDSILFDNVDVGRHAKIRRAIIDKDVEIPQGAQIGYDQELDRRRGFTITESGVTVIAKSDKIEGDSNSEQQGDGRSHGIQGPHGNITVSDPTR